MIGVTLLSLSLITSLAREKSLVLFPEAFADPVGASGEWSSPHPQRLLLVGGGARPAEALKQWVRWSKHAERRSRILLIAWASEKPLDAAESLRVDLRAAGAEDFIVSLAPPAHEADILTFLRQMDEADAVFFSGGDQVRIVQGWQDPRVLTRFRVAYWNQGIPFAGTSAGTAIMSEKMILGDGLPVADGLGFLPQTVTDQHFVVRKRLPRLYHALQEVELLRGQRFTGIGVEEDCALLWERSGTSPRFQARAFGPRPSLLLQPMMKVPGNRGTRYREIFIHPGDSMELAAPRPFPGGCSDLLGPDLTVFSIRR